MLRLKTFIKSLSRFFWSLSTAYQDFVYNFNQNILLGFNQTITLPRFWSNSLQNLTKIYLTFITRLPRNCRTRLYRTTPPQDFGPTPTMYDLVKTVSDHVIPRFTFRKSSGLLVSYRTRCACSSRGTADSPESGRGIACHAACPSGGPPGAVERCLPQLPPRTMAPAVRVAL